MIHYATFLIYVLLKSVRCWQSIKVLNKIDEEEEKINRFQRGKTITVNLLVGT